MSTDKGVTATNHYRLKIVEADSSNSYSPIRTANPEKKVTLWISPNPATGNSVTVRMTSISGAPVAYSLYSMSDAALQRGFFHNGENRLPLSGLRASNYILQTETGDRFTFQKLDAVAAAKASAQCSFL